MTLAAYRYFSPHRWAIRAVTGPPPGSMLPRSGGAERLPVEKLGFEESPAIGRITISSPSVMRPLTALNTGKPYWDQIKPFNFLLTSHVRAFGHPPGTDAERFHLIAPYETDPRKWLQSSWIDQYTGKQYRITTADYYRPRDATRVKTHGEALREYEFHPESKCADIQGKPCNRQTIGPLQRRHVRIDSITPIGKESNNLEGVEAGVIHSEQEVYTEYPDPRRDWETKILPALKNSPLATLAKACQGKCPGALSSIFAPSAADRVARTRRCSRQRSENFA